METPIWKEYFNASLCLISLIVYICLLRILKLSSNYRFKATFFIMFSVIGRKN